MKRLQRWLARWLGRRRPPDAPEDQRAVRGEVTTSDGVRIVLFEDTWSQHILATKRHPELAPHLDGVLATVASPDHREPDDRPRRERFFKQDVGPSRWLMVIVDFEQEPARIVTALAYGHGRSPREWID